MRIVYFYQYFGTPKGSWSTRVYELCKEWIASGNQVTVVTSPYEKSDIKAEGFISKQNIDGIDLVVINSGDSNRLPVWRRVLRSMRFSLISVYYALTLKYDVLISSSGPITVGIPLIFARKFRRKTCFFEVRDLWPEGGIEMGKITGKLQIRLARWFEKQCYKHAKAVVTSSPGQKEHIARRYPKLEIQVIPNASDVHVFGQKSESRLPGWTEGKQLFTHIGSLGLIHNMSYWMKVAEELQELEGHTIELVFIGDGAERQSLEEWKKKKSLNLVHFLGLKPKTDLPVWVQASVATLFATLDNPVQDTCSPNKIFDSFAAGVPIVQTSNGWIRDLVRDKQCGINVDLNDPKDCAQQMIRLSKDTELREQLSRNARNLAEGEFNRSRLAAEYLEIINE